MYTTNISLITAGSILKANGGCLIIRLNSLAVNNLSYYYLKKILISNKVSFDTNKSYLEFININGLKPKSIPVKLKVILVIMKLMIFYITQMKILKSYFH